MSEHEPAAGRTDEATEPQLDPGEAETSDTSLSDNEKLASLSELTGSNPLQKPPKLSFRSTEQIAPINTATEFFEGYSAVTYIYDDDENTLWIVPLNEYDEQDPSTKKLGDSPEDGFNARVVYEQLGLNYKKARRFDCEWVEKHEAVMVDMDQSPEKHG